MIHQLSVLVAALLLASCSQKQIPVASNYKADNSSYNTEIQFPAKASKPFENQSVYFRDANGKLIIEQSNYQMHLDSSSGYYRITNRYKKTPEYIMREKLNSNDYPNNLYGHYQSR